MPIFHVAFSSREMLVKRQILFLLNCLNDQKWRTVTHFWSHFMEVCEVNSHVSR